MAIASIRLRIEEVYLWCTYRCILDLSFCAVTDWRLLELTIANGSVNEALMRVVVRRLCRYDRHCYGAFAPSSQLTMRNNQQAESPC